MRAVCCIEQGQGRERLSIAKLMFPYATTPTYIVIKNTLISGTVRRTSKITASLYFFPDRHQSHAKSHRYEKKISFSRYEKALCHLESFWFIKLLDRISHDVPFFQFNIAISSAFLFLFSSQWNVSLRNISDRLSYNFIRNDVSRLFVIEHLHQTSSTARDEGVESREKGWTFCSSTGMFYYLFGTFRLHSFTSFFLASLKRRLSPDLKQR